jgi:hypothetical protein
MLHPEPQIEQAELPECIQNALGTVHVHAAFSARAAAVLLVPAAFWQATQNLKHPLAW